MYQVINRHTPRCLWQKLYDIFKRKRDREFMEREENALILQSQWKLITTHVKMWRRLTLCNPLAYRVDDPPTNKLIDVAKIAPFRGTVVF